MLPGYRLNRPLKQIAQNFKKNGFSNVDQFIADNFTVDSTTTIAQSVDSAGEKIVKSKNLEYLNDRGTGRISLGVRSLEAITRTLQGIPSGSLILFDQVIYTNPYNFTNTSLFDARTIIYQNLGMVDFIPLINSSVLDYLNILVDKMIVSIKNGTFTYNNYEPAALTTCKLVVRTAMNYNASIK